MSVANPVVDVWDGENRRIYLKQGVTSFHWMDDIYKEYRNERRLVESFRKWLPLLEASGNEPKSSTKATPRLVKLLQGTKVIPFDEAGDIQVRGEAITDNADIDPTLFDYSGITNPVVISYEPPSAEIIIVEAIQKVLDYRGAIHFDPTSSHIGQEHPIGTPARWVNNEVDALVLALKYNIDTIRVRNGAFNVLTTISDFVFSGSGRMAEIDVSGGDVQGCSFENVKLTGNLSSSGSVRVIDCNLSNLLSFNGVAIRCSLDDFLSLNAGMSTFVDCYSDVVGDSKPIVDADDKACFASFRNYSGGIFLQNATNSNATFNFDMDPGSLSLDNTDTAGTLVIRGTFDREGDGAGINIIEKIPVGIGGSTLSEQDKQDIANKTADTVWGKIV